jgi:flagellar biosynthetic protein FliQ
LIVVFITIIPILAIGLISGLAIAIFQAVTSIQEMTLSYVPKILISLIMIIILGPWMIRVVVSFSTSLIKSIPDLIR